MLLENACVVWGLLPDLAPFKGRKCTSLSFLERQMREPKCGLRSMWKTKGRSAGGLVEAFTGEETRQQGARQTGREGVFSEGAEI